MISKESYDALLRFVNPVETEELSKREQLLLDAGFIEPCATDVDFGEGYFQIFDSAYRITETGMDELRAFEKKSDEDAKQEKQRRFGNKLSVLNLLIPLITFIIGLLCEHYAGIVAFLTDLFH